MLMKNRNKSAFTLIEMLVVIGIIAILALGISMIRFGGATQSLSSAQQVMMSSFYEAKNAALAKHARVRVLIYKGPDYERTLRQVLIAHEILDENSGDSTWSVISETTLPKGSFFVPPETDFLNLCSIKGEYEVGDVFKSTFNTGVSGVPYTVGLSEASLIPQMMNENGSDYYCYEFAPEGFSENANALVMLAAGKLDAKSKLQVENPNEQLGFVIRRFGNCVAFKDYLEMETALKK